jgi:Arc/MetJ-type ribon-helix-helix transcriptional regulator
MLPQVYQLRLYECTEAACADHPSEDRGVCATLEKELVSSREALVALGGFYCPKLIDDWREGDLTSEALREANVDAAQCMKELCLDEDDESLCQMAAMRARSFGSPEDSEAIRSHLAALKQKKAGRKQTFKELREEMKEQEEERNKQAERACEHGHSISCARIAQQKDQAGDREAAKELATRACEIDGRWGSNSGGCQLKDGWNAP